MAKPKRRSAQRPAPRNGRPPTHEETMRAYYAGAAGDVHYLRRIGRRATIEGDFGTLEKAWRKGVDDRLRPAPRPTPRLAVTIRETPSAAKAQPRPGPQPGVTPEQFLEHVRTTGALSDAARANKLGISRYAVMRLRAETGVPAYQRPAP